MNKIVLYLGLSFLLVGCSKNKPFIQNLDPLSEAQSLKGKKVHFDEFIGSPMQILVKDSLLFINEFRNDYLLSIWNMNSRKLLKRVCPVGRGPDEFQPPLQVSFNLDKSILEIYGRMQYRFWEYAIDKHIDLKLIDEKGPFATNNRNLLKMDNNFFLGEGHFENGRFGISNKDGEEVLNVADFPELPIHAKNKEGDTNQVVKTMIYQSLYGCNPKEKKVAVAGKLIGIFQIYKYDLHHNFTLVKELKANDEVRLKQYLSGQRTRVEFEDSFPRGFSDINVTEDFIYTLYSGRTSQEASSSNKVIVYNWEGDAIKTFKLDKEISCFTIDNNKIFGIAENEDPELVVFEISSL